MLKNLSLVGALVGIVLSGGFGISVKADNIEGGYEVIKFTVENEKLISKTGEGFGEFDIINVEWDEIYVKFKNLSSDYSWSDFLAFDCE